MKRGANVRHTVEVQPAELDLPSSSAYELESQEASWQFYMHLAEGLFYLGDRDACLKYVAKAVEEAGEAGRSDPRLAKSLNAMGVLHCNHGNFGGAERALKQAIAIYQNAPGRNDAELAQAGDEG
ncbi:MAG TPA: tetratricopeptide repeat protein, partial [Bryobacteraceae bacterium]|nr:tetratricopeptide repeat protein [Bryobacteraceae bacterium]